MKNFRYKRISRYICVLMFIYVYVLACACVGGYVVIITIYSGIVLKKIIKEV